MEITGLNFFLLSMLTGIACQWCYNKGIREGADRCINMLHQQKVIAYDNKGEIYPNPFFKKK